MWRNVPEQNGVQDAEGAPSRLCDPYKKMDNLNTLKLTLLKE